MLLQWLKAKRKALVTKWYNKYVAISTWSLPAVVAEKEDRTPRIVEFYNFIKNSNGAYKGYNERIWECPDITTIEFENPPVISAEYVQYRIDNHLGKPVECPRIGSYSGVAFFSPNINEEKL